MRIMWWALALTSASACAIAGDPPYRVVSADEPLPADIAAGDIVRRGVIEVRVPEPGRRVRLVAEQENGVAIELAVHNSIDGIVDVGAPPAPSDVIAAVNPAECSDGAYSLMSYKWTSEYQWRFQVDSTPSKNNKLNVELALQNSADAITEQHTDCGLADEVSATHAYLGQTTTAPNISTPNDKISCDATDGQNVVGFGYLPGGTLAVACTYSEDWFGNLFGDDHTTEGDVTISTEYQWYALDVPATCFDSYGIQAVMTHEFGHIFGLNHVPEEEHPEMTMSPLIDPCTNATYTLGRGDILGLRQLY